MKSKKLLAAALAAVLTLAGCGTTVLSAEETKELLDAFAENHGNSGKHGSGNDDGNGYVHGRGNRGNYHSR